MKKPGVPDDYGQPHRDVPASDKPPSETGVIGMKTKFQLSFLVLIAPVFVSMVVLIVDVNGMRSDLKHSWSVANMAVWANQFQNDNPSSKVPKPFEIKKMMDPDFGSVPTHNPIAIVP